MADTIRTLASLQTLLADNGAGAISAQDLRDFLYTASVPRAFIYVSTPAATTCGVAGTWYKVAGTTTSTALNDMTMPANNRIYRSGSATLEFAFDVNLNYAGTATDDIEFGIDDTGAGTPADHTIIAHTCTGSADDHVSLSAYFSLANTEYAEVYVRNVNDTNNITVNEMQFRALGIIS